VTGSGNLNAVAEYESSSAGFPFQEPS